MMIRAAFVAAAIAIAGSSPALAQAQYPTATGAVVSGVVLMCELNGTAKPCDSSTPLQIAGTLSATIGGFAGNGSFTPLTATGSTSASTALPTGTVTDIHNTGTTAVSCVEAMGAATGLVNKLVIQPGAHVSRVNGAFDHIACIDQAGGDVTSNVVVLEGGAGLGNDSGGGGSGGGGGAVTNAGVFAVQLTGATNNINNIAGTVSLPTGAATSGNQTSQITQETSINTALGAPGALACATATTSCNLNQQIQLLIQQVQTGASGTGAGVPAGAIYVAGLASSAEPGKATTGNLTGLRLDLAGGLVNSPFANREVWVHGTASQTGTSATTLLAAAGAGFKNYAWVSCGRTDAATTAAFVTLNDTENTGSGHILVLPNNGGGGGNNMTQPIPVATAANTALQFTPSTGITTIYCNADGFTGY